MMAGEYPVSIGGDRDGCRRPREYRPPFPCSQKLQRLPQPLVVEDLGAGAQIRDAVDFGGVTHEAVDRPARWSARFQTRCHPICWNKSVLTPEDQTRLVAHDCVDTARDDLRDEIVL